MKATINSVNKIGESDNIAVQATFTGGSVKEFVFPAGTSKEDIKAKIKEEVNRLNSIDGQVADLQSLVGKEIN